MADSDDDIFAGLDDEDRAMLTDPALMARVVAAERAYARAAAGEDVNWPAIIDQYIVGPSLRDAFDG